MLAPTEFQLADTNFKPITPRPRLDRADLPADLLALSRRDQRWRAGARRAQSDRARVERLLQAGIYAEALILVLATLLPNRSPGPFLFQLRRA